MKKKCLWCGEEVSASELPLELVRGEMLCRGCAGDVAFDLDKICSDMSEEEFGVLKNKIFLDCRGRFDNDITAVIMAAVDKKYYGSYNNGTVNAELLKRIKNAASDANTNYPENDLDEGDYGMFGNIGGKIKMLAQIITWLGIIGSVILGLMLMASGEEFALAGIIVLVAGSLISWISSFLLYGFGQLVQNSDKIVKLLKK